MEANVYKIDSYRGGSLKEETSVTLDFRRSSAKRASGAPMRALINEETSRDVEARHQTPSVIARLMGLDTLPPPSAVSHRQQNEKSRESSVKLRRSSDRSIQAITSEHQEFKDVYEVMESSKFEKREVKPVWKGSPDENEDLSRQELMNAKCLSSEERLQKYRKMSGALEDIGSDKDVFMKFLHEPESNHLHDLKCFLPSPEPNITILRPSNNTKYGGSSDVFRGSERKAERYINCPKDVTLSRKPMTNFATNSLKEQESCSRKLLKSQYTGKTDSRLHPTRIVVLKPSLEKAYGTERDVSLPRSNQNLQFDLARHGEFQSSGIQELHEEGRERHKLFDSSQVTRHKTKGSREIAREITEQMRLRHVRDESSCIMSGMPRVNNSKASQRTSDDFHNWNNNYHPSTSYSSESSVGREARERLSDRWKMTNRSQEVGLSGRGSSTLGEMLALDDTETPRRIFDPFETQKMYGKIEIARHEVLPIQGRPLGTSSRGGWKDGCFTNLPRSRHSDSGSDSSDNCDMLKDVLNFGPIDSLHGYSIRRRASRRRSKCGRDKLHSFHSGGEENRLPVQDVHVKMEETKNIDTVNDFSEDSKPVLSELFDNKADFGYLVENSMHSESMDVEPACVSIDEQVQPQAEYVESPAGDRIDKSTEEESSVHLQEDIIPSGCDRVVSGSLVSSKEAEQPSPNSVLELLSEEESPSSQCFRKISVDLQGLRMQLQLLKLESEDTYGNDPQMLLSDEEMGREHLSDLLLGAIEHEIRDDERDFSYLLDVLVSSGIHGANKDRLFAACYSPEYPVDPALFERLEKKYEVLVTWSKSERKLLFDHINSIVAELLAPCMDLRPWVNSKSRLGPIRPPQGLAEAVLRIIVRQSKELCRGSPDDKVLDTEWLEIRDDSDMIGREIERMLKEELLQELVSEFISPWVL